MFKYFIHYDNQGKMVGYDKAPEFLIVADFSERTIEVNREEFEEKVNLWREERKSVP